MEDDNASALFFLGAQMLLAGVQGYGNALSQSQTMSSLSADHQSIATVIGGSNKYAFGRSPALRLIQCKAA